MGSEHDPQNHIQIQAIDLTDENVIAQIEIIEDEILDQQGTLVLWVDNPLFTLGAKSGNKIVGVVQVATDGHVNYIVHPEFQGRGIASELLQKAISTASHQGMEELFATVEPNSTSQHVLEKKGFTLVDQEGSRYIFAKTL